MNSCRILLIIAAGLIVWLASSLVHVENQRYAMQVGMCKDPVVGYDSACLKTVETRTSWVWHLFYALTGD